MWCCNTVVVCIEKLPFDLAALKRQRFLGTLLHGLDDSIETNIWRGRCFPHWEALIVKLGHHTITKRVTHYFFFQAPLCVDSVDQNPKPETDRMGLHAEARALLREAFSAAFSRGKMVLEPNEMAPSVAIVDFMQYVKVICDSAVVTKDDALRYFSDRVRWIVLSPEFFFREVIVLVDGAQHPIKGLVEGKKRADRIKPFVSPGDRSKRYLPADAAGRILPLEEWARFAGNQKLLRRELYPELFNALLSCHYFTPRPGQKLILSGFPGRSCYVDAYGALMQWTQHLDAHAAESRRVVMWQPQELPITQAMEDADPDLYHRVYILEHATFESGPRCITYEWDAARNAISEADLRMFWLSHWYRGDHVLFYVNDGDVFPIGALYAAQRVTAINTATRTYAWSNRHSVCSPFKLGMKKKSSKKKQEAEEPAAEEPEAEEQDERPRVEYTNLNRLYELMREYAPLCEAGTQNNVLTLTLMLIMAGSDFCAKFLHDMGPKKVIWRVFEDNAHFLSHLVQMPDPGCVGDTRAKRALVLDEDLFEQFIYACYLYKYDSHCGKLGVDKLSYAQLQERAQLKADLRTTQSDERFHLPDTNRIRLWSRTLLWNLEYWTNGPLGYEPDPFELWYGMPYYPFWRNPADAQDRRRVDFVSPRAKPVPHVFAQHMYRTRVLKRTAPLDEPDDEQQQEEEEEEEQRREAGREKQRRVIKQFG